MRCVRSRLNSSIIGEGSVYMNTQMKKGVLELCVLSMLSRGDRYGYELTESLSEEMSIAREPCTSYLRGSRMMSVLRHILWSRSRVRQRKYYHLTDKEMRHYCSRRTTGSSL